MEIVSLCCSTFHFFGGKMRLRESSVLMSIFPSHPGFPLLTATKSTLNLIRGFFQFSHARNQGGPGECQCGSGGPPGGNKETQLQPEPGPDQHQPHPQRPGLSWRGVRRHLCPAVPQHPPVTVPAADQRQLHTGTKLNATHSDMQNIWFGHKSKYSCFTRMVSSESTNWKWQF